LPSGRSVILRIGPEGEELEIRSPEGQSELRICLAESGPVVYLRSGSVNLEATEDVAIDCRRFAVRAAERLDMNTAGELLLRGHEFRLKTASDIHLDGDVIRLNCETAETVSEHAGHACNHSCGEVETP
jgi:phage gp45-like